MLKYSGRIVIDTQKHEFRLQAQEGTADPSLQGTVGAGLIRKYDITDTQLTITYVTPQGKANGANDLQEVEKENRYDRYDRYDRSQEPAFQSASFPRRS